MPDDSPDPTVEPFGCMSSMPPRCRTSARGSCSPSRCRIWRPCATTLRRRTAIRLTSSWRRSPRPGRSTARTRPSRHDPAPRAGRAGVEIPGLRRPRSSRPPQGEPALGALRVSGQRRRDRVRRDHEVCFKVETHNHPSAHRALTAARTPGVGGVIRDVLGRARAEADLQHRRVLRRPARHPAGRTARRACSIPDGSSTGWSRASRDYGNRMGIPTVNGAVVFDPRYLGNPLVFCGTVGVIARAATSHEAVEPGDRIVVARRAHRPRRHSRRDVLARSS